MQNQETQKLFYGLSRAKSSLQTENQNNILELIFQNSFHADLHKAVSQPTEQINSA